VFLCVIVASQLVQRKSREQASSQHDATGMETQEHHSAIHFPFPFAVSTRVRLCLLLLSRDEH